MTSLSPDPRGTRRGAIALGVLLLWSLALRVWLATPQLDSTRYWDERYSLDNVRAMAVDGTLHPANGFHPTLHHLPQGLVLGASQALYRATGLSFLQTFDEEGLAAMSPSRQPSYLRPLHVTPTGYLEARLLQAIFGTLSLWLLYSIVRRIAAPPAPLLATLLLSGVIWHVRQSSIFKPDIMLVLTTLIAFRWALDAFENPSRSRYARAGAGVGLALATKFNAGPAALPLILATALNLRRERRVWRWLVVAGLVSVVVFLLFNPYIVLDTDLYRQDFSKTLRDYEMKGALRGGDSHLYALWHGVLSLTSGNFYGPLLGGLGVIGLFLAPFLATGSPQRQRGALAMSSTYAFGYGLLYAASTTNPSPHNWLPVAPFAAIAAACLIARGWQELGKRLPILASPWAGSVGFSLLALLSLAPSAKLTYDLTTPSTLDQAAARLRAELRPPMNRVVFAEMAAGRELRVREGRDGATVFHRKDLSTVEDVDLDLADAELYFARAEDEVSPRAEHLRRRAQSADAVVDFSPRAFRARGPARTLVLHPFRVHRRVDAEVTVDAEAGRLRLAIPPSVRRGRPLSFEIRGQGWRFGPATAEGIGEIAIDEIGYRGIVRSARFRSSAGSRFIDIDFAPAAGREPTAPPRPVAKIVEWKPRP